MDGGRILKADGSVSALMGLCLDAAGSVTGGQCLEGAGRDISDIIAGWYTRDRPVFAYGHRTLYFDHICLYAPVTSYNGHISYLDTSVYKCILNAEKGLNGAYTAF